jgi:hypothetical protein
MASQEGFFTNEVWLFDKEEGDGYVYNINKEKSLFMAMDTKSTNIENEDNQKERKKFKRRKY